MITQPKSENNLTANLPDIDEKFNIYYNIKDDIYLVALGKEKEWDIVKSPQSPFNICGNLGKFRSTQVNKALVMPLCKDIKFITNNSENPIIEVGTLKDFSKLKKTYIYASNYPLANFSSIPERIGNSEIYCSKSLIRRHKINDKRVAYIAVPPSNSNFKIDFEDNNEYYSFSFDFKSNTSNLINTSKKVTIQNKLIDNIGFIVDLSQNKIYPINKYKYYR